MTKLTGLCRSCFSKATYLAFAVFSMFLLSCSGPGTIETKNLEEGFQNPPESAKPRVWWHWMNGNISKEGIRADLEWMNRTGIGGFQNFDAGLASPQIVEKRLVFMTPEWKDAFLFTTKLADSLGLEMAIAGSPGWSESGGPWVTPAQAMKKLVWSEIRIEGGKTFSGILPKPPIATGAFQNIARSEGFSGGGSAQRPVPEFYSDAAVVAFRLPDKDISILDLNPRISSSSGKFELSSLVDGDLTNSTFLPAAKRNEKAWIQFEFKEPVTVHSLTIVKRESGMRIPGFSGPGVSRSLEVSDNGKDFRSACEIPAGGNLQNTYTFLPVTAKYFRITFLMPPAPDMDPAIASMFGINRSKAASSEAGDQYCRTCPSYCCTSEPV